MSKYVIAVALMVASATGAAAQSGCVEPAAPLPIDGAAVTADQLRAAMAEARNFIAQSNLFQDCVLREVDAARGQAAADRTPFDGSVRAAAMARVDANQRMKQRVSDAAATAVDVYKKTHAN